MDKSQMTPEAREITERALEYASEKTKEFLLTVGGHFHKSIATAYMDGVIETMDRLIKETETDNAERAERIVCKNSLPV